MLQDIGIAERPFTPRLMNTRQRLSMRVSETDAEKITRGSLEHMGRITDLNTGRQYDAWGADCGLDGCVCDAVVTEVIQ